MALFGGSRDISLFNTISKELINDIIQIEVGYYKFVLERTSVNVYGESEGKVFYEPVRIACLMKKEDQAWSSDDFGSDVDQTIDFRFLKQELKDINLVPEVGDILLFKNNFYEIDTRVENQLLLGELNDVELEEKIEKTIRVNLTLQGGSKLGKKKDRKKICMHSDSFEFIL